MSPIEEAFRAGYKMAADDHTEIDEINERARDFVAASPLLHDDDIATLRHFVASHESEHSPRTREAVIRLLDAWAS